MTWADSTWAANPWAVDAGAPPPPAAVSVVLGRRPATIHATIDGRPVRIDGWAAETAANFGPRTFTGEIPLACTWAMQETPVDLWLDDQEHLWSGVLVADPQTSGGVRRFKAQGWAEDLAVNTRLLYRHDGAEGFADRNSDPHDYDTPGEEKFDLEADRGTLKWKFGNGADNFGVDNRNGFAFWAEGATLTRYEFECTANQSITNFDLYTRTGTGPSGGLTLEITHGLAITSPVTRQRNLTAAEDMLVIDVVANSGVTPTGRRRVTVRKIKIYGRTTDDAFSASDVVADVGAEAGFNTALVETNPLGVLPLDWTDDHTALLDYMAELTDWRWLTMGRELAFGPWARTWTAYLDTDAVGDLEPLPRVNRVRVPYRAPSGVLRHAVADATDDPFPGQTVTYTADELEGTHSLDDLPSAYAATLVERMSTRRVAGSVSLGRVYDDRGAPRSPYTVKPGDLLNLPDSGLPPQRIQAVTYRSGEVTANLSEDDDPARMLVYIRAHQRRPRRRKRR